MKGKAEGGAEEVCIMTGSVWGRDLHPIQIELEDVSKFGYVILYKKV